MLMYRVTDKSLARPGRKQYTATEDFEFHIIYNHNWRNISNIFIYIGNISNIYIYIGNISYIYIYIYIYITRLTSNEIFSPSNKIHREVGRAKDLPAPRYIFPVLAR
jgi:hypothetical protein